MIIMSTKTCHDISKYHAMLPCQRLTLMCAHVNIHPPMSLTNIPAYVLSIHVKFNHYKKTGSSGVKGRVRSYSIYIQNLKLVGSVQRVSNPDQNVKFHHNKKADSSGVKGRVRSYSIYIENLKLVGSVQRGSNPDQKVNFNQYRALPTHPGFQQ